MRRSVNGENNVTAHVLGVSQPAPRRLGTRPLRRRFHVFSPGSVAGTSSDPLRSPWLPS